MKFYYLSIGIILLSLISIAFAIDVEDFDKNNDRLLSKQELKAFLIHSSGYPMKLLDKDKDGKIDADAVFYKMEDAINAIGKVPPYTFDDVKRIYEIKESKSFLSKTGLLIRSSHEQIFLAEPEKSAKKAKPAKFSYSRDGINDNDIWQASGSIMRPFILTQKPSSEKAGAHNPGIAFALVPSISFERISNDSNEDAEVDTLVFRLGSEFENIGFIGELQYFRLNLAFATDFDVESDIRAVEFQWEPVALDYGLGAYKEIGGFFNAMGRLILHSEFGKTYDAAGRNDLNDDEKFFRIGPIFSLDIKPIALERLTLSGKFQYREGLSGDPDDATLWEVALNYALDVDEHYSVEFGYKDGDIPLTDDDIKTFGVGFAVKF